MKEPESLHTGGDDKTLVEDAPIVGSLSPRKSMIAIVLEVALISAGVFLGLAGEQWRENAQHREMAEASLRRFRAEISTNRKAVAAVRDYHASTMKALETYFAADVTARPTPAPRLMGLQPAAFEDTAWDLALATQSLAYLEPELAFALARIYSRQQAYEDLTRGIVQAMYLRPPSDNLEAFLRAVAVYYGDIVLIEPALLSMYDELLPEIDRTLEQ
jgi:hypothetical protein